MYCPKCGKELPEGTRFCGYCGTDIEGNNSHPVSVDENEFKVLKKCFTDPYADEILSPVLSVVVFVSLFFINWLAFYRMAINGLAVTVVVLAGIYLLEYIDKGHECDFKEMTGRIGFHLVLPAVLMLGSGIFLYFFWDGLESYMQNLIYNITYGSYNGNFMLSLPDMGPAVIGVILEFLSVVSFVLIEGHGLHRKSAGFVYAAIIIITLILVASGAIVIKNVVGEITSMVQNLVSGIQ